jgi:glycosyltransferase involved in cell wall biosynthesis
VKRLKSSFATLGRRAWFARHRGRFAEPSAGRPRVFVDVSVIARNDARTGIQRVVRAIWLELSRRDHPLYDFKPVYAGTRHGYLHAHWDETTDRPTLTRELVTARPGDKFLGLDLAAHYTPHCVDQLAAWRAAGLTTHFVVYDLLPLMRPGWFNAQTVHHFERWCATIVSQGDSLLCISDEVADQVRERLTPSSELKVGRLHLSGDLTHSRPSTGMTPDVAETLATMGQCPVLLMVGTVEPRKGYAAALRAMECLWADGGRDAPALLIVGKAGWKTETLQQQIRGHPEHRRRLHWLEGVSDEALERAYAGASALLLATRSEGFGLPLVEATRHRKWVLARDLPVFREQSLANVHYFSDDAPAALAASIERVMAAAARGSPPVQHLPSWSDCADRLLVEIGVDDETTFEARYKRVSAPAAAGR